MGAQVIVGGPDEPDPLYTQPPLLAAGESALYRFLAADKREKRWPPELALEDALDLQAFDLVVFPSGDPAADAYRAAGLPVVEIALWPTELEAERAGQQVHEHQLMAVGGLLDLLGDPSREPLRLPGHQLAYAAGFSAFTASMAALLNPTGNSSFKARVSLAETAAWINWKAVIGAATGVPTTRRGTRADFQVLPCRDGWVAFVYTPSQFDRVRAMLDDPAADAPQFATRAARAENVDRLMALVERWFATRSREEIYSEARRHGVALGPVFAPHELLDDEQYRLRDFLVPLPGEMTDLHMPGLPLMVDGERLQRFAGSEAPAAELSAVL